SSRPLVFCIVAPPIATLTPSLHDALPIFVVDGDERSDRLGGLQGLAGIPEVAETAQHVDEELALPLVASEVVDAVHADPATVLRSEEHTSKLQSRENLVCRLLLEKKRRRT